MADCSAYGARLPLLPRFERLLSPLLLLHACMERHCLEMKPLRHRRGEDCFLHEPFPAILDLLGEVHLVFGAETCFGPPTHKPPTDGCLHEPLPAIQALLGDVHLVCGAETLPTHDPPTPRFFRTTRHPWAKMATDCMTFV